jgi:branched-chain amino acid transport system substrate-binding protein
MSPAAGLPRAAVTISAVAALAALGVAGCGSKGNESSAASDGSGTGTATIGFIWSNSGLFAPYSEPVNNGLDMAVEKVNAAGGLTVNGKKYKLVVKKVDDRSEQQASVTAATSLMRDDNIKVIIGPIGPLAPAVAKVVQANKGVLITTSSSAGALAGKPGYENLFAAVPKTTKRVATSVQAMQKFAPDTKKVAMVGPNDETWQGLSPLFKAEFEKLGWSVKQYPYPAGANDLSVTTTKLAAGKPDLVQLMGSQGDWLKQIPALKTAGLPKSVPYFVYAGSSSLSEQADGHPIIADPLSSADFTSPSATDQAEQYEADLKAFLKTEKLDPLAIVSQYFYDTIPLVAKAMEDAGTTTDALKIADSLRKVTVTGVSGDEVGFTDDNAVTGGLDYTYVNGDKAETVHLG